MATGGEWCAGGVCSLRVGQKPIRAHPLVPISFFTLVMSGRCRGNAVVIPRWYPGGTEAVVTETGCVGTLR